MEIRESNNNKITSRDYKGYGIDYNVYGQGEYSVQFDGDDIIFHSIEDAEDFIDTLEPLEECTKHSDRKVIVTEETTDPIKTALDLLARYVWYDDDPSGDSILRLAKRGKDVDAALELLRDYIQHSDEYVLGNRNDEFRIYEAAVRALNNSMNEDIEMKEFVPDIANMNESDAQRDSIRDQAKIKTATRLENEEEKFEHVKDKLKTHEFDLYEEFGEEADNVLHILEEIDSFVHDYDLDNYEDEVGDEDGVEYAYYNLKTKGVDGIRADLDQLVADGQYSDDEEDLEYWDRYYADRYNHIVEALDTFYDNPNTPLGEFIDEGKEARIADYRKYAGIKEDFKITEENIDDRALSKVACLNYRSKDDIKAELLDAE